MAGEKSQDAVKREVTEETGLDVSDCEPEYLFTYKRVIPEPVIIILLTCTGL